MSSTENPVGSTETPAAPTANEASPIPPKPPDAFDPGEPSAQMYNGFYDRVPKEANPVEPFRFVAEIGEVMDERVTTHIRLLVTAPLTKPTDPKHKAVHFPLALLYQMSKALKQTYANAIIVADKDLIPAINEKNIIPSIIEDPSALLTNDENKAQELTINYMLHCKSNKNDILSGIITIQSDIPYYQLRYSAQQRRETAFCQWMKANGVLMHETNQSMSQPVLAGYLFGTIPREKENKLLADSLTAGFRTEFLSPNDPRRQRNYKIDVVAKTLHVSKQSGRAYAVLTEPAMKDDVMEGISGSDLFQIQPNPTFGNMFFISMNEWNSISNNYTTTTSSATRAGDNSNNKKKRTEKTHKSCERMALLKQQSDNMENFQDKTLSLNVSDPEEIILGENMTLMQYLATIKAGDGKPLMENICYNETTHHLIFFISRSHRTEAFAWIDLFITEMAFTLDETQFASFFDAATNEAMSTEMRDNAREHDRWTPNKARAVYGQIHNQQRNHNSAPASPAKRSKHNDSKPAPATQMIFSVAQRPMLTDEEAQSNTGKTRQSKRKATARPVTYANAVQQNQTQATTTTRTRSNGPGRGAATMHNGGRGGRGGSGNAPNVPNPPLTQPPAATLPTGATGPVTAHTPVTREWISQYMAQEVNKRIAEAVETSVNALAAKQRADEEEKHDKRYREMQQHLTDMVERMNTNNIALMQTYLGPMQATLGQYQQILVGAGLLAPVVTPTNHQLPPQVQHPAPPHAVNFLSFGCSPQMYQQSQGHASMQMGMMPYSNPYPTHQPHYTPPANPASAAISAPPAPSNQGLDSTEMHTEEEEYTVVFRGRPSKNFPNTKMLPDTPLHDDYDGVDTDANQLRRPSKNFPNTKMLPNKPLDNRFSPLMCDDDDDDGVDRDKNEIHLDEADMASQAPTVATSNQQSSLEAAIAIANAVSRGQQLAEQTTAETLRQQQQPAPRLKAGQLPNMEEDSDGSVPDGTTETMYDGESDDSSSVYMSPDRETTIPNPLPKLLKASDKVPVVKTRKIIKARRKTVDPTLHASAGTSSTPAGMNHET